MASLQALRALLVRVLFRVQAMTTGADGVPILELWAALGGGELKRSAGQFRGRAFWRDGDRDNISLSPDTGRWFDFVTNTGGGWLTLTETALGVSRRDALRWLEDNGLLPRRDGREIAARQAMRSEAQSIADYYSALKANLLEYRLALVDLRGIEAPGSPDWYRVNGRIGRLDNLLDQLAETPTSELIRRYRQMKPAPIPHEGKIYAATLDRIACNLLGVK